jgi:hypothetical protein
MNMADVTRKLQWHFSTEQLHPQPLLHLGERTRAIHFASTWLQSQLSLATSDFMLGFAILNNGR